MPFHTWLCRALFETQIPCPPVKKSLKISPIRSLRRSIGGPLQAHPRRYTDVASVASTDKKPIAKGKISSRGNSVPEDELHGRVHLLNLQVYLQRKQSVLSHVCLLSSHIFQIKLSLSLKKV